MNKEYNRTDRIAESIKRSLSLLIQQTIKDPRLHDLIITLTRVTVTKDLMHAKILYSYFGETDPKTRKMVQSGLENASGFLRKQLSIDSDLRRMPELHFVYDPTLADAARIGRLIDEAVKKDEPDPSE